VAGGWATAWRIENGYLQYRGLQFPALVIDPKAAKNSGAQKAAKSWVAAAAATRSRLINPTPRTARKNKMEAARQTDTPTFANISNVCLCNDKRVLCRQLRLLVFCTHTNSQYFSVCFIAPPPSYRGISMFGG